MRTKFLFIFLLIAFNLSSQNEFNNWFFGAGNGLNFSTPNPTLVLGSPINQIEGVASISDASGNLLFYTTGLVVYDRTHNIMLNGTGLLGDGSSTQSSIIIKKPLSNTNYYIFTADADVGADGIRWSEVNMSLNGGLGGVTANKNILLKTPSCEKLCAVRHCNGKDIWVISHDWNSGVFTAWLMDGIFNPGSITVWSLSGSVITGVNQSAYGQLKASSDGRRLAAAYYGISIGTGTNKVEVYDFNASTGIVTNALTLTSTDAGVYGVEFSPSGRMLYVSTNQGKLFQWDLCSSNVIGSKFLLQNTGPFMGSLQMANNGKMYLSRGTASFLSSISFPEIYGNGCFFTSNAVALTGQSRFGLPNFPSYYLNTIYPVTVTQSTCNSFCFTYPAATPTCGSTGPSYQWVFNDGTTQTGTTVCKTFSSNQSVLLKVIGSCVTDSIFIPISVGSSSVNISPIYRAN